VLEDDEWHLGEPLGRLDLGCAPPEVGERDALAVVLELPSASGGRLLAEQPPERRVDLGMQRVHGHDACDVSRVAAREQLHDIAAERGADEHDRALVEHAVQLSGDGAGGWRRLRVAVVAAARRARTG
jgi:hypothetical protein